MKTVIALIQILLWAATSYAADAVRVAGDIKVNGIHFSDSSTMSSSNDLLKNKGAWSASALYSAGDVVQSDGSSFACIVANTNMLPPNVTYWSSLAKAGPQGPQGLPGQSGSGAINANSAVVFCYGVTECYCAAGKVVKAALSVKCEDDHVLNGSYLIDLSATGWGADCFRLNVITGIYGAVASVNFEPSAPHHIVIACTTP